MVLHEQAWARVDARAERAGLALTAWVGLMAGEVAGGAVAVGEELLEGLAGARVGVARIGAAVNSMAATGHLGGVVSEELLVGVLGRLAGRVEAAVAAAQAVGREGSGSPAAVVGGPGAVEGRGRRSQGSVPRGRVITVWFSPGERALVGAAAAAEGLSAAAWVGLLVEDPGSCRPLRGEVWGAVYALRKALRRVATNLAQIESVRGGDEPGGAQLEAARGQVEAAIRVCLEAEERLREQAWVVAA